MKNRLRKWLLGFGLIYCLCIASACNLGPTGGHRGEFTAGTIASLSPSSIMAGGPPFNLTVHGSNFQPGNYDVLLWNGVQQIPAVGVGMSTDTTQATYVIDAALIANPGNISIVLIVPTAPGVRPSNALTLRLSRTPPPHVPFSVFTIFYSPASTRVPRITRSSARTMGGICSQARSGLTPTGILAAN